ncbi:hypothetical protein Sjap_009300 [Stephania japonica]|uniref:Uncharacterized protein n=1 Tax=Stephania japonica TaxID=461633 RepID=A0AAP0JRT9_9MAGN
MFKFLKGRTKVLWRYASLAILWHVWLESNGRIFNHLDRIQGDIWDDIKRSVGAWLQNDHQFKLWDRQSLLGNWNFFDYF